MLEASAIRYLALAGERALALDVDRAEQSLAHALELAPSGHPERAFLLERWAQAAQQQGRLEEAKDGARGGARPSTASGRERGRWPGVDRARDRAPSPRRPAREGDGRRGARACSRRSRPVRSSSPPTPSCARCAFIGSAYPEAIAAAERALQLAAELGLPEPARALGCRGNARAYLGERQGLEDMRRALQLAIEQGLGREAAVLHNNLAIAVWTYEGPQAALAACRDGIDFCERRGITEFAVAIASMSTTFLAELGADRAGV